MIYAKMGFSAIFSRLVHLIDITGMIIPRKGFFVDFINFASLENEFSIQLMVHLSTLGL